MPRKGTVGKVTRAKMWEVVKATTKDVIGIGGEGRFMKFGSSGAFTTRDPGLARSIDKKYGRRGGTGEVVVVEVDDERQFERGHRYVFTMPERPWKRKGPAEKPEKWYEKTGRILGSFRSYPRVDNADYEARETNDG